MGVEEETQDIDIQVEDVTTRGWFPIDNAVVSVHGSTIRADGLAVYCVLRSYAGRKREAWPKQQTIANLLGISRRRVNEAAQKLEEAGLIEASYRYREDGTRSSKLYRILDVPGDYVTIRYKACNDTLQQNNTQLTRSYMEDSPNPPDPPSGVEESSTPREVVTEWERTKGQTLRSRCLQTIRSANEQLTANGKPDPRAKASALRTIYLALFGDTYPPEIPRLMKLAGQSGGPERLVLRMLEASTREVVGNPHDLLTRWKADKQQGSSGEWSPWDNTVS